MKKRHGYFIRGQREQPKPALPSPAALVQVGDRVSRVCVTLTGQDGFDTKCPARLTGRVVWVHPRGRFHVVEFPFPGGKLRECFWG